MREPHLAVPRDDDDAALALDARADLVGQGRSATEAAEEAVRTLGARVQGEGGVIVVGRHGDVGFAHNTPVMSRAWVRPDGTIVAEM